MQCRWKFHVYHESLQKIKAMFPSSCSCVSHKCGRSITRNIAGNESVVISYGIVAAKVQHSPIPTKFFSKNQHNILHPPHPHPPSLALSRTTRISRTSSPQKIPPTAQNGTEGFFSFLSYHLQHRTQSHRTHKPHITILVHSIEPHLVHIPHPRHHHPQLIVAVIFKVQTPHYVVHMKKEIVRTATQQRTSIFQQRRLQL